MQFLKIIIIFFSLFLYSIIGGNDGDDPFGKLPYSQQQPAAETNPNPWPSTIIHGDPINNYALHLQRPQQPAETLSPPTRVGPFTSLLTDDLSSKGNYDGLRFHIPQHYQGVPAAGEQFGEHKKAEPKILGKRNIEDITPTEKGKQKAWDFENTGNRSNKKGVRHTPEQISILNEYYERDKNSGGKIRKEIAENIGLTPHQVENRRAQDKKVATSQQVKLLNEELEQLRTENLFLQQKVHELQQQLLQYQQQPINGVVHFDQMAAPSQPQEQQQHQQMQQQHFAQTEHFLVDDFLQNYEGENV